MNNIKETVVMGIDQSLTHTGVSIININRDVLLYTETIETTKELDDTARCTFIAEHIIKQIKKYNVDRINMEGYAFFVKGNYSYRAGELGGTIKYLLRKKGLPFNIVPPASHKKQFTGSGKAKKLEMIERVLKIYGETLNEHEADATSIGIYKK